MADQETKVLEIRRTLDLDAPPERVWAAITDPTELSRWFPDRAEVSAVAGARGSLTWESHGTFPLEVVEVDAPRRFVWRWAGNDGRGLDDYATLVEWTLKPRAGGGTTLELRESGFDTELHHRQNSGGWDAELAELVDYLASSLCTRRTPARDPLHFYHGLLSAPGHTRR